MIKSRLTILISIKFIAAKMVLRINTFSMLLSIMAVMVLLVQEVRTLHSLYPFNLTIYTLWYTSFTYPRIINSPILRGVK